MTDGIIALKSFSLLGGDEDFDEDDEEDDGTDIARHYSKCFTYINSFNFHNNPLM